MCGIVGYTGKRQASEVVIKGLHRLGYRGYDSVGVAIMNDDLKTVKTKGKVKDLEPQVSRIGGAQLSGIGHTRWATHGEPNEINAHPHSGGNEQFALVHNGIIENYDALKRELQEKGHRFAGDTDTEVLAHLIEEIHEIGGMDFLSAVKQALLQVNGAYGIAIIHKDHPDQIIIACKGSSLMIGIGKDEHFVTSDASSVIEYTKRVVYLEDEEIATVRRDGYEVSTLKNVPLTKEVHELAMSLEQIEKGGFPHFMLKEIFEQVDTIADCMRGRLMVRENRVQLGGLTEVLDRLCRARRVIIAACGTSWHAGLIGEYLMEYLAHMPVEVEYASEFRYREQLIDERDVMLVISQSGETTDTLVALREAKKRGALVLGICNAVGSTIARETDAGVYIHAGPEIGVASTKAFTAQVTVLVMMALLIGRENKVISDELMRDLTSELSAIPDKVRQIVADTAHIENIARLFTFAPNFLYLGRSFNFPVALEGALKLKEISYIHAEGYPAAEVKHGPIALIDEHMPVVVIAATDYTNDKVVSNIEEVKARKGRIISISSNGQSEVARLAEFNINIPETHDCLTPLLAVIPLQLLSYYVAVNRKCDVDNPRNLSKSVTVE
ncbi:glutamine--fructose-6-phosphate transaminase (isomerizing) [Balneolales bacterium ANBcel1]|nr:glutamine--fructose-6-phosphate transaminase (isomerizing) [Balneolales bacterium ANBcel1]